MRSGGRGMGSDGRRRVPYILLLSGLLTPNKSNPFSGGFVWTQLGFRFELSLRLAIENRFSFVLGLVAAGTDKIRLNFWRTQLEKKWGLISGPDFSLPQAGTRRALAKNSILPKGATVSTPKGGETVDDLSFLFSFVFTFIFVGKSRLSVGKSRLSIGVKADTQRVKADFQSVGIYPPSKSSKFRHHPSIEVSDRPQSY